MSSTVKGSFPTRVFLLFFLVQIGLGIFAYHDGFPVYFHQDDFSIHMLLGKDYEVDPGAVLNIFYPSDEVTRARHRFRPLLGASLAWDYYLYRVDPYGYRLTNLGVHLLCVLVIMILAYRFLRRCAWRRGAAFLAGILFNLYPVHPHVVTWILARSDAMATFSCITALLLFHNFALGGKRKFYIFALVFFAVALMSKELAITLPFVIFLFDFLYLREPGWIGRGTRVIRRSLPFFLLLAFYFFYRKLIYGHFIGTYGGEQSALTMEGVQTFLTDLPRILFKILAPVNEAVFSKGEETIFVLLIIPGVFVPFLAALIIRKKIPYRPLLFFLGWLAIAFLPQIGVMKFQPRLERGRFLYPIIVPLTLSLSLFIGSARFFSGPFLKQRKIITITAALLVSISFFFSLQGSLAAFVEMGRLAWTIPQDINRRYKSLPEATSVVILNTPKGYDGAPLYLYGLELALRKPFNTFNMPVKTYFSGETPPLEEIISGTPKPLAIFRWNWYLRRFDTVRLPPPDETKAIKLLNPPEGAVLEVNSKGSEFSFRSSRDFAFYRIHFEWTGGRLTFLLEAEKLRRSGDRHFLWNLLEGDSKGKTRYPPPEEALRSEISWYVVGGNDPERRFEEKDRSGKRTFTFVPEGAGRKR